MDETVYLAALNKCFYGNWSIAHSLLEHFGSAKAIFGADRKTLGNLLPRMEDKVLQITEGGLPEAAFDEMEYCRREDITAVSINDDDYPARLTETREAPLVLFKRGSRRLNGPRFIAIVGTRHCTQYSKRYCDLLAEYFSSLKVKPVIVSGMAYGIDTMAHQSALRYGLDTVAVTATGQDIVYPFSNRNLAAKIEERGAVITEFWSGTQSFPFNFVCRNRIVAGMSDATVVVESRIKGGSLITARAAFNYNRDVFAFPGKLEDVNFEGCNMLIAANMAHLIRSGADICMELGWTDSDRDTESEGMSPRFASLPAEKQTILKAMARGGEMDAAQIAAECGAGVSRISYLLLEMEIEGLVRHISTNKFVPL